MTDNEAPGFLATAISEGDLPHRELLLLSTAIERFVREGRRYCDSDQAATRFASLPDIVSVYRGTVEEETAGAYGVSWTLDKSIAVWFATANRRFRNTDSRPILLEATIARDRIFGLLTSRSESEVLICPKHLSRIDRTNLD